MKIQANPKTPAMFQGGFVDSSVVMPIGRRTALYWLPDDTKQAPLHADSPVIVRSKPVQGTTVRNATKDMMLRAERFLFSPERNDHVAKLFSKTTRPKRMRFSSPFDTMQERRRAKREEREEGS